VYQADPMSHTDNQLIEHLPKSVRKRFIARCEPFELVLSSELSKRGAPLTHAYFPITGFISLVIDIDSHPPLEVGMAGRESMLGSELALGMAKTPWRALVQGEGSCWRIEARALRKAMADMPALQSVVERSLMVRLHQQALASACERFHPIGQRLARWLLMSQDRADTDHFHVTQEFISLMLGVRRVGVTQAASDFQKDGLIQYSRGELRVLDRAKLEQEACSCYEADKLLHTALMNEKISK
jgi:CRP-like cAMP-binding protein